MKSFVCFCRFKFPFIPCLFFLICTGVSAKPFADQPPENDSIKKLFSKSVHLEVGVQGKPLPTNDWWTSLLANKDFPGRLYAYPFTVSANAHGIQIWYPLEWNQDGTEMEAGAPLVIEPIDPTPDPNPVEKNTV
jgi:hypothetical protein